MFDERKKCLRIVDCAQNSPEWYAVRLGKVTASKLSDVMAGGAGKMRDGYKLQLVLERATGNRKEGFTSKAMKDGIEREPDAAARYSFTTGIDLAEVGFVLHPTLDFSGASPDRLAGADGVVQFKCPEAATHYAYLKGATLPTAYVQQMQWEMACTKSAWCDFVSFHPDFPISKRLHIRRIKRDPVYIVKAEAAVREFLAEVEAELAELMADEVREEVAA